ncbi:MAG: hypothetical protein JO247_19160 [Chloroflexi bacterium]|nr:hypothetical protein [Chloroflexota bacterium]
MPELVPVTDDGQISIPADVRRRWGATKVYVQDCGDHLEVRPASEDGDRETAEAARRRHELIESLRGSLKLPPGVTVDSLMADYRREELAAEERKWREYEGPPHDESTDAG